MASLLGVFQGSAKKATYGYSMLNKVAGKVHPYFAWSNKANFDMIPPPKAWYNIRVNLIPDRYELLKKVNPKRFLAKKNLPCPDILPLRKTDKVMPKCRMQKNEKHFGAVFSIPPADRIPPNLS
ncbi:hypothetical protein [Anaerotignum sp.]|uniref:hypothetical protein n=1 Tax=Anaerotignum sp. TaxID=2039241 RepID=UPI0028A7FCDB|nr:hypothetical protein [Anaerotignum sp.]